ncbi:MAG: hypothetical protein LBQ54_13615 [Planctomycetaceae bacterium]|jgi:hypothetical protein|nr:hypothetical protein [Planctomycetaceae bacterium]
MSNRFHLLVICGVFCVVSFLGCRRKPEGFPQVWPCSVTIVNGSTPIEGASVTFHYEAGANAPVTVTGVTGTNGTAVMKSMQTSYVTAGAPAGKCKVVVKKNPFVPDTRTNEEKKAMSLDETEAYKQSLIDAADKMPREIPPILEGPWSTPIAFEVSESQATLTIDVSKISK